MKHMLIGILINVTIIGTFLFFIPRPILDKASPDFFDPLIYGDTCSIDYVDIKIMGYVQRNPEEWKNKINPDQKINSINEIPDQKLARNEYALLKKFKCPISTELEHSIFLKLHSDLEKEPQIQDCPISFKEEEVLKHFNYIYRDPYYAYKYEEQLISKINKELSDSSKKIIQEKFKDPKFRKKITLAIIQMYEREKFNCRLQSLPIWPITKELLVLSIASVKSMSKK